MKNTEMKTSEFTMYIKEAVHKLRDSEFEDAYSFITEAIKVNPNAPEPHNLLGIWYEFNGNNDLARKHYRIAYVLNPIYKPASENLERVSTLFLSRNIHVNFGDDMEAEPEEAKSKITAKQEEQAAQAVLRK